MLPAMAVYPKEPVKLLGGSFSLTIYLRLVLRLHADPCRTGFPQGCHSTGKHTGRGPLPPGEEREEN